MLTQFRKGANNFFVKILLVFIALSFVGIGAVGFLSGNSGGDIVKFNKADSIPIEEFFAKRSREIDYLQRQTSVPITEEQINSLNINFRVLQKLIADSMINYLAQLYDFDISDELVIDYVKTMPHFKNEDGVFDVKRFKSAFHNSSKAEDKFLEDMKSDLIKDSLVNVFMESFSPSKEMIYNMVRYALETRYFDVLSIDLLNKENLPVEYVVKEEDLRKFYNKNQGDFTVPELRAFNYLVAEKGFFFEKSVISNDQAREYYEMNQNEFDDKPYSELEEEVISLLRSNRAEDLMNEISRKLEGDVAAGLSLQEILEKYDEKEYGLKLASVNAVSKEGLLGDKNLNFVEIVDSIFEMDESEISYPMEIQDQQKLLLLEVKEIIGQRRQEFAEVKEQIADTLQRQEVIAKNIEVLQKVRQDYVEQELDLAKLASKGVLIKKDEFVSRGDFFKGGISHQLVYFIFNTKKGDVTSLTRDGDKAYFAFVKDINIDEREIEKAPPENLQEIARMIKVGVIQELIDYLAEENDMEIRMSDYNLSNL